MTNTQLASYNPHWERQYLEQYKKLPELWKQAVAEVRELGAMRRETKQAYVKTVADMRKARSCKFKTAADVASRVFNVLASRAVLNGAERIEPPAPESFKTLADVRRFFVDEMARIKDARKRKNAPVSFGLPVLPKGEGAAFNGTGDHEKLTQAFFLPDVDGGFPFIVVTELVDDVRYVCVAGRSSSTRFRTHLPQIATLLAVRLFAGEDAGAMRFFVHHPIGFGPKGHEQYWAYDLRVDAQGRFHMAGRTRLDTVPYDVAYKNFADGKCEKETSIFTLDKYYVYMPGVEMLVRSMEAKRAAEKPVAGPVFH